MTTTLTTNARRGAAIAAPGPVRVPRWFLWLMSSCALIALTGWLVLVVLQATAEPIPVPAVAPILIETTFPPRPTLQITMTADWTKVPKTVDLEALLFNPAVWRRMHFDDWDGVAMPHREAGLRNMVRVFGPLINAPRHWDGMRASDWDDIPQPIRALAFMQMMGYWSGHYQVGTLYGLPRGTVTNTLNAIVMVESWFEHRAVSISRSGNRDLGLGQMSDFARAALWRMHSRGLVDFAPIDDSGYFNPWMATRMTAIWFDLMLDEQGGDLDSAIRAYHRGTPLAQTEPGEAYLENVKEKRRQFMRDRTGTPAWEILLSRRLFVVDDDDQILGANLP